MDDKSRLTLSESLRSTASDLGQAVAVIAALRRTDEEEIRQQADILDMVASDARDGACILRAMIIRQRNSLPAFPPRHAPPDPP